MTGHNRSYLETELDAVREETESGFTFTFQREKVKLLDGLEANVIKEADPFFQKEVSVSEDEVTITIRPPSSYQAFRYIKGKDKKSRWQFAYRLVQAVKQHKLKRLNLIAAPENIVFDKALTPYFLHYGIKESLPPYEEDRERVLKELKACAALAADGAFTFEEYLKYKETLQFSPEVKSVLEAKTFEELEETILTVIDSLEARDKTYIKLPKKKWKIQRYAGLALAVLLVPALLYSLYVLFFAQPKQEAITESNRYFLNQQYSKVIDTLAKYDAESLPESVQYELASSYVAVEKLSEEQRKNIGNLVTLQSDPKHFLYWIDIGRGENEEAINIGRNLEYNPYIWLGLTKYKQQLLADDSMKDDEKQKELDAVESELEKAKKEQEEQNKEADENTAEASAGQDKDGKKDEAKDNKESDKKDEKKDEKK
ncbi:type VII secretion protein EssB [Bacillus siamensis]|uniref:type VII secretion protein EssB n=1 Tax=Bacillus siamensis TaxID=659243 RepID=UPI000309A6AE|nr:type VII secretion protein EssB [Bacillus siamensis]MED0771317.1 type VII secretion protein EssB [Bacillus siamensis]MED0774192.1 type VII secretion protein EssB [Bacillus siamensis]MED0779126.1 type VII secretion protein EssB [Bacillus siamensis]MED0833712.1 type VII secretion protein EssB [Bacillus siamensis]